MSFGLDKCKVGLLHIEKGKVLASEGHQMEGGGGIISAMDEDDTYKYLGFHQCQRLNHQEARKHISKVYLERVKKILQAHLNGKNLLRLLTLLPSQCSHTTAFE